MSFKKFVFQLHKILGLVTGVIVFIVAITGCCWVFKDEIEGLNDDYKQVAPQNEAMITPTAIKAKANAIFPENTIHGVVYGKADEAIEVIFYDAEPEFYKSIFFNPYSGETLYLKDHLSGFFAFVLKGHMRLWLPKNIGEQVVSASILIFILIIISGFILWIPKKRKHLKQRIKFDWKKTTRWKRKNFDLHTVVGFYICSIALVLAFTGCIISYNWLKYVVYKTAGGDKVAAFVIPKNTAQNNVTEGRLAPIDTLIVKLKRESPDAVAYELHYPATKDESIYVEITNSEGLYYNNDYRFFDQNTLEELETPGVYGKYKDAGVAEKILRMNYDIHIGAIGGIGGKIIAFLASLITASLPVTGILLWYGRKFKKKRSHQEI
ncbi:MULTISPECIES: PepSY domain-containing protein [unclassified Leeuwenhoekiella]|uniref:PepSY-associated TM helix domain-containing protein n=1 Tax=unclassified Leeuwenhoekiella TaxID=2615029 RepID=UPI000C48465C|nr:MULTISPECIES: PepSY-associated TM helix domain-containing protein [unclassified Leeuwenhoekiella]MAW95461.1 sulfite reductase [Leeuwenhoekiella sp.]MBA80848.1 sulfite reductase [Leeuwenhoekiella sp.]|tara:strand:- start:4463 stop:5599 length:1137 start_codon:yes stop_codon:yes gene_type:complete